MRADRLLQIVGLLRQHGRLSADDLARRLEVAPRTILRDMEALSTAGVPVVAERGRLGGFSLLRGYRPATEDLTAAETQALLLAGSVPADRLGLAAPLASALRKLAGTAPPEHGRTAARINERIVVDAAGWTGGPEDLPQFQTVQEAVLADRRLRLRYRPRNVEHAGLRTVDPYGLVQAAGTWYLIAAHRGRPRTYRIGRIDAAHVLPEPSGRPADLDLRALWRQLRSDFVRRPELSVRLEVLDRRPAELLIMLAGVGSGRPEVDPGPPMTVRVEVLSVHAAVAALGGLGARVRVLEPPELVAAVRANAEELQQLYG